MLFTDVWGVRYAQVQPKFVMRRTVKALVIPCHHTAWICLQATYAKLTWNAPGTGLLALTATDTDATNQSYYGEQKLSFLSADGTNDCLVQLKVGVGLDVVK